ISDNLIDYVRADGTTMGLSLVQAIDVTANMVWVDKPLNQAKSNIVNHNGNPPMRAAMDNISTIFPTFVEASNEIYRIEFFLRNLAATGQYFAGTSAIFSATALRVQTALSEITPSTVIDDDSSIPLLFNTWLTGLINAYPADCQARANAAYTYYRASMNTLATRLGQPVPACFPLYTANVVRPYPRRYNPSTFNPQILIPAAPASPRCNVPGTEGVVTYIETAPAGALGAVGILQYGTNNGDVKIMGSGNTDFYAVGSGQSISGNHVQGKSLSDFTGCPTAYLFNDVAPGTAGYLTANIAFTCGNGLGAQDVDINFVMNGQAL
ncbi:hypothetical protein DFH09DRAFT_1457933, partial [Mycena vulgaris]